jgi:HEAT repeat protein
VGPKAEDVPALLRLLKDRSATTQEAVGRCVARIGPPAKDAVPGLVKMLDHPEGEVRAAAALALGELGPAALPAVPKLRELRGDARNSDPIAGPAARKALAKLGVEK